jgi:hypothetical protein
MNVAILVAIAVVLTLAIVALARRSRPDAVSDFHRQINALSAEARRPVVDQVHKFEVQAEQPAEPVQPEDAERPDGS